MASELQIQNVRHDRTRLEQALKDAGCDHIRGNIARCPWHEDKHPSGSIYRVTDGAWKFMCHKCDICEDVIGIQARSLGKSNGDVLLALGPDPERKPEPAVREKWYPTLEALKASVWNLEACYCYADPVTRKPELVVIRQGLPDGGKKFIQFQPATGGFEKGAPPKPWPLYNRTRLVTAEWVVVVEGEKCVHALADAGIVATTSPCGAGKAEHADWKPLAGKRVYLWADNDEVGQTHMRDVARILEKLDPVPDVRWVNISELELPPKGDVVDYLEGYKDFAAAEKRQAVELVLEASAGSGPSMELGKLLEDAIAGRWMAIEWPWPILSKLTQALLPGTVTCVCGDPGCGKSFLLLESCWWWQADQDIKVAVYELEEDRRYHLQRALAQLDENSELTDAEWVRKNADGTRAAFKAHRLTLDGLGRRMWDAPDAPPRLEELREWVEARAAEGCRVIVLDPITAAKAEDKPWVADQKFVMAVKTIARKHSCSIIIATHPRMGKQGKPLDGLAGGAAYPRFSQTVLWIDRYDQPKPVLLQGMKDPNYPIRPAQRTATINRSIRIGKARNGRGAGLLIGFDFLPNSLRFAEQGIVTGNAE